MKNNQIPKRTELFEATIQALRNLNGSGTISEINDEIFSLMKIPEKVLSIRRKSNEKQA